MVFTSGATNLVVSDTHGSDDAFVRVSGKTTRVSVSSSGQQANDFSGYFSSISADGRYVAFKAICTHPGQYYVNVHTADYPAGAVRGQLHN